METLFEISFEVCNKVGGIYTVISSKVSYAMKSAERYITIGPWIRDKKNDLFIQAKEYEVPSEIQECFDVLSRQGIYCTYGWWNLKGKPECILIDAKNITNINNYKKEFWDKNNVDSINSAYDFNEPFAFSIGSGMLIEKYKQIKKGNVSSHFHEWMSGFGILYLKNRNIDVNTIFTTHATILGRTLQSITKLEKSSDTLAKENGVLAKHTTEKACAKFSDHFTTVSTITAKEAYNFFGIKPLVVNNGLEVKSFPSGKKMIYEQVLQRKKIEKFLSSWFAPENFEDYMFIYTSGRPEYTNKGYDTLLETLKQLKDRKIVCFILVPWQANDRKPTGNLITHYLYDEENNPIAKKLEEFSTKDKLKVIYYPCYLGSSQDILINQDYYEFTKGFDLGVFASRYEPWGYTPLECISNGVPCIATDSTGFGKSCISKKINSVKIIKTGKDEIQQLKKKIIYYLDKDENKKMKYSLESRELADKFDWKNFFPKYEKLY
ncbi:MAG: glycosyltransferase [Nanobdellota archaeon]